MGVKKGLIMKVPKAYPTSGSDVIASRIELIHNDLFPVRMHMKKVRKHHEIVGECAGARGRTRRQPMVAG